MSPREPADVSAGASRCLCASQPMQYSTRLPSFYEGKLFSKFAGTIYEIFRNYLLNFPELFTKFSGTIY